VCVHTCSDHFAWASLLVTLRSIVVRLLDLFNISTYLNLFLRKKRLFTVAPCLSDAIFIPFCHSRIASMTDSLRTSSRDVDKNSWSVLFLVSSLSLSLAFRSALLVRFHRNSTFCPCRGIVIHKSLNLHCFSNSFCPTTISKQNRRGSLSRFGHFGLSSDEFFSLIFISDFSLHFLFVMIRVAQFVRTSSFAVDFFTQLSAFIRGRRRPRWRRAEERKRGDTHSYLSFTRFDFNLAKHHEPIERQIHSGFRSEGERERDRNQLH
jgi:hypothetical protein